MLESSPSLISSLDSGSLACILKTSPKPDSPYSTIISSGQSYHLDSKLLLPCFNRPWFRYFNPFYQIFSYTLMISFSSPTLLKNTTNFFTTRHHHRSSWNHAFPSKNRNWEKRNWFCRHPPTRWNLHSPTSHFYCVAKVPESSLLPKDGPTISWPGKLYGRFHPPHSQTTSHSFPAFIQKSSTLKLPAPQSSSNSQSPFQTSSPLHIPEHSTPRIL